MAVKSNLVNLDAMIKREDFAAKDSDVLDFENVATISLRDFTTGGLMGPSLRKPDFQRETNHWTPEQVVSLLKCFVNGDLIPSVILWKSTASIFVIDGGHRLSVLRAWIEDDYGDGPISQKFFNYEISDAQKRNARRTKALVDEEIGTWQHFQTRNADSSLDPEERKRLNIVISRGLPIQWVRGDADKAESSFFQINTKGTPLDEIEELLLRNRLKPVAIAARAVIRAGTGHKYWSRFSMEISQQIESYSKKLHSSLFDPEVKSPVKTLDLPLGGPKGVRTALQVLIELMLTANEGQTGPIEVTDQPDDVDGTATIGVLRKTLELMERITGNDKGSLGLHPAVYFYGPSGRHSSAMFMGTARLIANKLANNDKDFFKKFSKIRAKLESLLINHKDLIATILQRNISGKRVSRHSAMLDGAVKALYEGTAVTEANLVTMSGLEGKIIVGSGSTETAGRKFSDDAKSQAYIAAALSSAIKCEICQGYIDPTRSLSYDHDKRVADNGTSHVSNLHLTHPYCNQSVKN
jgi:hypothetical protein